uniref:Uncharacterized protein n=1 Tax=Arundo donax TaxID=35708 RepID=A0A0A9AGL8_ARUDO
MGSNSRDINLAVNKIKNIDYDRLAVAPRKKQV